MGAARVQLRDVDVHASVIRPVVRKCDNKTNAILLRRADNGVKARDSEATGIESGYAILPELVVSTVFLRGGNIVEAPSKWRIVISFYNATL